MSTVSERTARKTKVPASVPYEPWLKQRLAADPEQAALYLQAAVEEADKANDPGIFQMALKDVADARGGVAFLARETGHNRTHLYQIFSRQGNPTFSSLWDMLRALHVRFTISIRKPAGPLSRRTGHARTRKQHA